MGSTQLRRAVIRVVACNHLDLEQMVAGRIFRKDRYTA